MFCCAKSMRQERHTTCIPKAADMHGEGHVGYSQHEQHWEVLIKPSAEALQFKKLTKKPADMEQDKMDNHKHYDIALAIAAFLGPCY